MYFMKTAQTVSLLITVTLALASDPVSAETVILGGTNGLTDLFVHVPAGKVMIVRASSLPESSYFYSPITITSGGDTIHVGTGVFTTMLQPRYLAGPCTFTWSNLDPSSPGAVFSYDVVPANGIQTLIATNRAVIKVPSGKRLRLLDGSYPLSLSVTLTNGASATFAVSARAEYSAATIGIGVLCTTDGFELLGPLDVTVVPYSYCFMTYFFASDVTETVGQAIQASAGSIVTVEKSTDLEVWYPAYLVNEKNAPKAFYRLSVVR